MVKVKTSKVADNEVEPDRRPREEQVRVIITQGEHVSRSNLVTENPGKLFMVIGPFDSFSDKDELSHAVELVCRGYNLERTGRKIP